VWQNCQFFGPRFDEVADYVGCDRPIGGSMPAR